MMEALKRLRGAVSEVDLRGALDITSGNIAPGWLAALDLEDVGRQADLTSVEAEISKYLSGDTGEAEIGIALHACLDGILSGRERTDIRFWQWMTLVRFADFTNARWSLPGSALTAADSDGWTDRRLGGETLGGYARNAVARLFFAAQALDGNLDLLKKALSKEDIIVSVFERRLGLYPPVAKACVTTFTDSPHSGAEVKRKTKLLQQKLKMRAIEAMDEDEVAELLKTL